MKLVKLFSLAAASFALASFTTACSWFQDDSEEQISRFYQPDDGITSRNAAGNGAGGSALDNDSPCDTTGLVEDDRGGVGSWGENPAGAGGQGGEMYADFGTRIPGVDFEPVYFLFDQNPVAFGIFPS